MLHYLHYHYFKLWNKGSQTALGRDDTGLCGHGCWHDTAAVRQNVFQLYGQMKDTVDADVTDIDGLD